MATCSTKYELVGDKDAAQVARLLTTIGKRKEPSYPHRVRDAKEAASRHFRAEADMFLAITKNGITKLGGAPPLDLERSQTDKKITDEEILKILEQPACPQHRQEEEQGEEEEDPYRGISGSLAKSGDRWWHRWVGCRGWTAGMGRVLL